MGKHCSEEENNKPEKHFYSFASTINYFKRNMKVSTKDMKGS